MSTKKAAFWAAFFTYRLGFDQPGQQKFLLKADQAVSRPAKYLRRIYSATFTRAISTGTSTRGPITATKASPELRPNTAMATAIASSKLLDAAVNDSVADCS